MTATRLFLPCQQADSFARTFRDADPDLLAKEIEALHRECEGTVTIQSKYVTVTCTCPCHKKAGDSNGR